jgi:serine/threonine protein phosphatase PrpC
MIPKLIGLREGSLSDTKNNFRMMDIHRFKKHAVKMIADPSKANLPNNKKQRTNLQESPSSIRDLQSRRDINFNPMFVKSLSKDSKRELHTSRGRMSRSVGLVDYATLTERLEPVPIDYSRVLATGDSINLEPPQPNYSQERRLVKTAQPDMEPTIFGLQSRRNIFGSKQTSSNPTNKFLETMNPIRTLYAQNNKPRLELKARLSTSKELAIPPRITRNKTSRSLNSTDGMQRSSGLWNNSTSDKMYSTFDFGRSRVKGAGWPERLYRKERDPTIIHSIFEFEGNGRLAPGSRDRTQFAISLKIRSLLRKHTTQATVCHKEKPEMNFSLRQKISLDNKQIANIVSSTRGENSLDDGPFSVNKSLLSVFQNVSKPKVVHLPVLGSASASARLVSPVVPIATRLDSSLLTGVAAFTHEGVCDTVNQDRVLLYTPHDTALPKGVDVVDILGPTPHSLGHVLRAVDYSLFAVLDGHGGTRAVEYCEAHFGAHFVDGLLRTFAPQVRHRLQLQTTLDASLSLDLDATNLAPIEDSYTCRFEEMQRFVKGFCGRFDDQLVDYLASTDTQDQSGVALVAVFTLLGHMYSMQIGNCKALMIESFTDTGLKVLTNDHVPSSNAEGQRITQNGGHLLRPSTPYIQIEDQSKGGMKFVHPPKTTSLAIFPGYLVISRTLGDHQMKRFYPNLVSNDPDVSELPSSFAYILLGSAGLFDAIPDHSLIPSLVKEVLRQHNFATDVAACEAVSVALSQRVLGFGPRNNFSGVLLSSSIIRQPYQITQPDVHGAKLKLSQKRFSWHSLESSK